MPDLTIDDIWTFQNLGDPMSRSYAFSLASFLPVSDPGYCDPFGIALKITAGQAMSADIRIQLVNYRQDPSTGKMWFDRNGVRPTIDLDGDLPGFNFLKTAGLPAGQTILWMWWKRYSDLFGGVGSGLEPCICAVRAEIQSGFFDIFAATEPFAWSYTFTVL
jgi:hypothetical protein